MTNLSMDAIMKSGSYTSPQFFILNLMFIFGCFCLRADDGIQFKSDKLTIDLGGKLNTESFFSNNMTFFNASINEDSIFFIRTTFDFYSTFTQGDYDQPRLIFYDTFRFRFKWGTPAEIKSEDSSLTLSTTTIPVKGTATNKHLLWMRESWLKIMLGSLGEHNNYVQVGLIPYQVGRGISLGTAYNTTGYLGFNPGSSIDQYAPAVLFSFNPIPKRFNVDFYAALTENKQTSLSENAALIHAHELNACAKRGTGRQSVLVAMRSEIAAYKKDQENVTFEPYIIHLHAPDQPLEFPYDVDAFISTAGMSIEGAGNRYSWGIEGATNFGSFYIRPWDRNYTTIAKDDTTGSLFEQFTKVYTQDPATTLKPTPAKNTKNIATFLEGSPHNRSENGKYIGTVDATPLYNAFDRFRPEQQRFLSGYFFVADVIYEFIPKAFNAAIGIGYASGYIDHQCDTNVIPSDELMNGLFPAFIPLQSVYSGKRLRHLVLFNEGVPRFNVKLPNADLSGKNVTAVQTTDIVNEMTNIAFIGTRFDWRVQAWKKSAVNIAQNIVCYWAPETADYTIPDDSDVAVDDVPIGLRVIATEHSSNFIGTEFTTEFSAMLYEKIKISGYFGVIFPGPHYKDMAGTIIKKHNVPTGCDLGYVGNIGAAYFF